MGEPKQRIVRSDFHCPKCGGSTWGTSGCTGPRRDTRGHCHNFACDFVWLRTEDWRYFRFTIVPTRAEYRRLEAQRIRESNRRLKTSEIRSTETKGGRDV